MYYTLQLNDSQLACYAASRSSGDAPWTDLCARAVQILSQWLEEACNDLDISDATFHRIDGIQAAFVRREQTFALPYTIALPEAGKLDAQTLTVGRVSWQVKQVVLFGDDKAGHMTTTGGAAPWPVLSDMPGEQGQFYWLKPGEFTLTEYYTR